MDPACIQLRAPRPEDGLRVWELVQDCGVLELNTAYAYVLLCSHFAGTSVVAEVEGRLVGAVCSYRPPEEPSSIFVWQVGVHPEARGIGLGRRMLEALATRLVPLGVRQLTATVTPSNTASRALFESFARARGARLIETPGFPAALFPSGSDHEPEIGLEIGPLDSERRHA